MVKAENNTKTQPIKPHKQLDFSTRKGKVFDKLIKKKTKPATEVTSEFSWLSKTSRHLSLSVKLHTTFDPSFFLSCVCAFK